MKKEEEKYHKKFEKIYNPNDPKHNPLGIHCNPKKDVYYIGQFNTKAYFDGRGLMKKDRKITFAQFSKNKKSGIGRVIESKSRVFTGVFFQNKRDGIGILHDFKGKLLKKGNYSKGNLNGFGTLKLSGNIESADMEKIKSMFNEFGNNRHSLCADVKTKTLEDFSIWGENQLDYCYRGLFKNGEICGFGEEFTSEKNKSSIYQGEFLDGFRTGIGYYVDFPKSSGVNYLNSSRSLKDSKFILAKWRKGKKEGFGIQHFQNNDIFQGYFSNNVINGIGIYIHEARDQKESKDIDLLKSRKMMNNDFFNPLSSESLTFPMQYIGCFQNGKRHNFGRLESKNRFYYIGSWNDDFRDGLGYQVNYKDENTYIPHSRREALLSSSDIHSTYFGYWKSDKINGIGIKTTETYIFKGNWRNGKPHGYGLMEYRESKETLYGCWSDGKFIQIDQSSRNNSHKR